MHAYLDSGANAHLFKDKGVFGDIKETQTSLTTVCGDDYSTQTRLGSTYSLNSQNGTPIPMGSEAIYHPKLVENLVSVGKICDEGHTIVFDQNKSGVYK